VALLNGDGWLLNASGIRTKAGQPLAFNLTVPADPAYLKVAKLLSGQWKRIGIEVSVQPEQSLDFQSSLSSHTYDAVLYGISIGVDPDVFIYWDSAQADVSSTEPLNFSEFRSDVADEALQAGRTRLGNQLRTIKYQQFLQVWQQDAPALALYQPRLLYVSHVPIYGLTATQINTDADRFSNVQNWMIRTGWVSNKT